MAHKYPLSVESDDTDEQPVERGVLARLRARVGR